MNMLQIILLHHSNIKMIIFAHIKYIFLEFHHENLNNLNHFEYFILTFNLFLITQYSNKYKL